MIIIYNRTQNQLLKVKLAKIIQFIEGGQNEKIFAS